MSHTQTPGSTTPLGKTERQIMADKEELWEDAYSGDISFLRTPRSDGPEGLDIAVMGIPYDLVLRARRQGGQHEADLEDMVRINVTRLLYISRTTGLALLSFGCLLLSSLAVAGFYYRFEFAQAVFLLLFPMTLIALLSLSTARALEIEDLAREQLYKRLARSVS